MGRLCHQNAWQPTFKAASVCRILSKESARLGGRRNVSKTASKSLSKTWSSTSVGVAKSPLGPVRQKTDGPQKHRGTRRVQRQWLPSPLQHPHTHVLCVDEPSGFGLASIAILGPTTASVQSEVMVIFDLSKDEQHRTTNSSLVLFVQTFYALFK